MAAKRHKPEEAVREKRGRGRPPWNPTADQRRLVEHYTAIGYTQEQIAALMEVDADTLAKHCRRELDLGALQVNAKIGGALFKKAMSGDTASLIFWAKTRMGWKETQTINLKDDRVPPDLSRMTEEQLEALETLRSLAPFGDGVEGSC